MKKYNLLTLAFLLTIVSVQAQTLDSSEPKSEGQSFTLTRPELNTPLYVITEDNNKMYVYSGRNFTNLTTPDDVMEKINNSWINLVTVLKDKNATDQYGVMGQHGVIVITLKEGSLNKMPPDLREKFQIE